MAYVGILVWVRSGVGGKKPLVSEHIFIHLLNLDFIRERSLLSALRALNITKVLLPSHSGQTEPGLEFGFILKRQNWSLCSAFQESFQMGTQRLNFPWKHMSLEGIHVRSTDYFQEHKVIKVGPCGDFLQLSWKAQLKWSWDWEHKQPHSVDVLTQPCLY